jgi:hypothetical protein
MFQSQRDLYRPKARAGLILIKDTTGALGNTGGMQNAAQSSSRASSAHQADDLLETARTFFLLAGNATAPADVVRYAAIGRDYLERAHAAASVDVIGPMPRNRDLP